MRVNSTVVLGSDSYVVELSIPRRVKLECKIHQISKSRFVAFAGATESPFYDLVAIAKKFSSESLDKEVWGFEKAIRPQLLRSIRYFSQYPLKYPEIKRNISGEIPWLDAIFMEQGSGTTRVDSREFFAAQNTKDMEKRTIRKRCPGDCRTGDILWRFGNREVSETEAQEAVQRFPVAVAAVKWIIDQESQRTPNLVGPPINLLIITPFGAYWNPGSNQGCPAIE